MTAAGPGRIRTLYADLDGTLLGPGGSLFASADGPSSAAAEAVALLHDRGVGLVLVSGRTRDQMREVARVLGAEGYVAELGAFVVERSGFPEEVIENFGEYRGRTTPFRAIAASGAGGFLLDRFAGRLEPHAPWAFQDREATMLFRGFLDLAEATGVLARAGYDWLELLDNGVIRRPFPGLDVAEVHAYHLTPRGVNKRTAVELHRTRHGLAVEETAAVGDSLSDAQMAGAVGSMFIVGGVFGQTHDEGIHVVHEPGGEGFAKVVRTLID